MNDATELPLSLYKANLELQVRIGKLIQEGGRQWLDFGHRLISDGIAESDAEVKELLSTRDWQRLASLPAESFWRQVQQRFGDSQAVAQIAFGAQATFANGLQEALRSWQEETSSLLAEYGASLPLEPAGWDGWPAAWESLLAPATAASTPSATATATAGAPRSRPRKAAPAKRAGKAAAKRGTRRK